MFPLVLFIALALEPAFVRGAIRIAAEAPRHLRGEHDLVEYIRRIAAARATSA